MLLCELPATVPIAILPFVDMPSSQFTLLIVHVLIHPGRVRESTEKQRILRNGITCMFSNYCPVAADLEHSRREGTADTTAANNQCNTVQRNECRKLVTPLPGAIAKRYLLRRRVPAVPLRCLHVPQRRAKPRFIERSRYRQFCAGPPVLCCCGGRRDPHAPRLDLLSDRRAAVGQRHTMRQRQWYWYP